MDKKDVINYLWKRYRGSISIEDLINILGTYCRDNGKKDDSLIELFIFLVSAQGIIIPLVDHALSKYKLVHGIVEVYKPTEFGDREIILIY